MYRGFSLLECLIVVAIISILTLIGYPTYQRHVATVERNRAKITLWEMAHRLEVRRVIDGSYQLAKQESIVPAIHSTRYQFYILARSSQHYIVAAKPSLVQRQFQFASCQALTLDDQGRHCWP